MKGLAIIVFFCLSAPPSTLVSAAAFNSSSDNATIYQLDRNAMDPSTSRASYTDCSNASEQRRARCFLDMLRKSDLTPVASGFKQMAVAAIQSMNITIPMANMTIEEIISGLRALSILGPEYRALRAAGVPLIQNVTDLRQTELLNATRLYMQSRNLTFNETNLWNVLLSIDTLLFITPTRDMRDPTACFVAVMNTAPPTRRREISLHLAGEIYYKNYANLSDPLSRALDQQVRSNLTEVFEKNCGTLLAYVTTAILNGTKKVGNQTYTAVIVRGVVNFEPSLNCTNMSIPRSFRDSLDAVLSEAKRTGRMANMPVNGANCTGDAFVPCARAKNKNQRIRCLWEQILIIDSIEAMVALVNVTGPAAAKTELAKWDTPKFLAARDTLDAAVKACGVLKTTARFVCITSTLLNDPKVLAEVYQTISFQNGTVDVTGAKVLQTVADSFFKSIDGSYTFGDVLSNQDFANVTVLTIRIAGNCSDDLKNSSSRAFKDQAYAILTQMRAAIVAQGGSVMRMKVRNFTCDDTSIQADLEIAYGNTPAAKTGSDPLKSARDGAIKSRLLGNLVVLNGTINALGINVTAFDACANMTNQTARISCFWQVLVNQTNVTMLQNLVSTFANASLKTEVSKLSSSQLKNGIESLTMFIVECRNANATMAQNCSGGPARIATALVDKIRASLSNLTNSTWDPQAAELIKRIFEEILLKKDPSRSTQFKDFLQSKVDVKKLSPAGTGKSNTDRRTSAFGSVSSLTGSSSGSLKPFGDLPAPPGLRPPSAFGSIGGQQQGSCNPNEPKHKRSSCTMNRLLDPNPGTITGIRALASVLQNGTNATVPVLAMTDEQITQGLIGLKALINAQKASLAAGGPLLKNCSDLERSDLVAAATQDLQSKNLTLNLVAASNVCVSWDMALKAAPMTDPKDPTASCIAMINSAAPARVREVSLLVTSEAYYASYKDLNASDTKALVQRICANISAALNASGGNLISCIPKEIRNTSTGGILFKGRVVYENLPPGAAGNTGQTTVRGDSFTRMMNSMNMTGFMGRMKLDRSNCSAEAFVPCKNASTTQQKIDCAWILFQRANDPKDLVALTPINTTDAALTTRVSAWTETKLISSMCSLRALIDACRVINATSGAPCNVSTFTTNPNVTSEAQKLLRFGCNGTLDTAGAADLLALLRAYLTTIDPNFNLFVLMSNQRSVTRNSTSLRVAGTFTPAMRNNRSAEYIAQCNAIITQFSGVIAAYGGDVLRMECNSLANGSIFADITTFVGETAAALGNSVKASIADLNAGKVMGNQLVLSAAIGSLNMTAVEACRNRTNCTEKVNCFWQLVNQTDVTSFQAFVRTLIGNNSLISQIAQWGSSQLTNSLATVRAITEACLNSSDPVANCSSGLANVSQTLIAQAQQIFARNSGNNATWNLTAARYVMSVYGELVRNCINGSGDGLRGLIQSRLAALPKMASALQGAVRTAVEDAMKSANSGGVASTLQNAANATKVAVKAVQNAVQTAVKDASNTLKNTMNSATTAIRNGLGNLFNRGFQSGKSSSASSQASADSATIIDSNFGTEAYRILQDRKQGIVSNIEAGMQQAEQRAGQDIQRIQSAAGKRGQNAAFANALRNGLDAALGAGQTAAKQSMSGQLQTSKQTAPSRAAASKQPLPDYKNALTDALNCYNRPSLTNMSQCVTSELTAFALNTDAFLQLLRNSTQDGSAATISSFTEDEVEEMMDSLRLLFNALKIWRGTSGTPFTNVLDVLKSSVVNAASAIAQSEGNSTFNATLLRPLLSALNGALQRFPFLAVLNNVPPAWPRDMSLHFDMNFTDALKDPKSNESLQLRADVREWMQNMLGDVDGMFLHAANWSVYNGSVKINMTAYYESWSLGKDAMTVAVQTAENSGDTSMGSSLPLDISKSLIDSPLLCQSAPNLSMVPPCAMGNFRVMFCDEASNLMSRGVALLNGTQSQAALSAMTEAQVRGAASSFRALDIYRRIENEKNAATFTDATQFFSKEAVAAATEFVQLTGGKFDQTGADVIMRVLEQFLAKRLNSTTKVTALDALKSTRGCYQTTKDMVLRRPLVAPLSGPTGPTTTTLRPPASTAYVPTQEDLAITTQICNQIRIQIQAINGRQEMCMPVTYTGNASASAATFKIWACENPGFVKPNASAPDLITRVLDFLAAKGMNTTRTADEEYKQQADVNKPTTTPPRSPAAGVTSSASRDQQRSPQENCNDMPGTKARAACMTRQLLSGRQESVGPILRLARIMKEFLNKTLPILALNSEQLMMGFKGANGTIAAYRSEVATGKQPISTLDEIYTPSILNSTKMHLAMQNVTYNEAFIRQVLYSLDEIVKASPVNGTNDPTSGLTELINACPQVTTTNTTFRFTGEPYDKVYADLNHPTTQAVVQKTATSIVEAARKSGVPVCTYIVTGIRNGSTIVDGKLVTDPSASTTTTTTSTSTTSTGGSTDPSVDAFMANVKSTGAVEGLAIDPASTSANTSIPCSTTTTKVDKCACWRTFLFSKAENLADLTLLAGTDQTLRAQISQMTPDQLKAGAETLSSSFDACKVAATAGKPCSDKTFLTDEAVQQEARNMTNFRANAQHNTAAATILTSIFNAGLAKFNASLTVADLLSNQRPARKGKASLRLDETFKETLSDMTSADAKALAENVKTQFAASCKLQGVEVYNVEVTGFRAGSVFTDVNVTYGETATSPNTTTVDPVKAAADAVASSGTLGNLTVLTETNITSLCTNMSAVCSCWWDTWDNLDTTTEFAAVSSLLPKTDPLSTVPTQAALDDMRLAMKEVIANYRGNLARTPTASRRSLTDMTGIFGNATLMASVGQYYSLMYGQTLDTAQVQKLATSLSLYLDLSFPRQGITLAKCINDLPVASQKTVQLIFAAAYNASYADPQSQAYKDFVKSLNLAFRGAVQSKGAEVLELRVEKIFPGSTGVDATVTYDVSTTTATDPVQAAVTDAASSQTMGDMALNSAQSCDNTTSCATTTTTAASTSTVSTTPFTGTTTKYTGPTTTGPTGTTVAAGSTTKVTTTAAAGASGGAGATTTAPAAGGSATGAGGAGATTTAASGTGSGGTGTTTGSGTGTTTRSGTGATGTGTGTTTGSGTGTAGSGTGTTIGSGTGTAGTGTGTTAGSGTGTAGTGTGASGTGAATSGSGTASGGNAAATTAATTTTTAATGPGTDTCTLRTGLDFHRCAWNIFARLDTKSEIAAEITRLSPFSPGVAGMLSTVNAWSDDSVTIAFRSFSQIVIAFQRSRLPLESATNLTAYTDLWNPTLVKSATEQLKTERNITFNLDLAKVMANLFDARVKAMYTDKQMNGTSAINGLRPAAARQASFKINRDFKDVYNDLTSPETKLFMDEICKAVTSTIESNNGILVDCIILKLKPGSTIADVKLVYESDPIPADKMGSPAPDSIDASITSMKSSGKLGNMPVDPAALTVSSKTNVDRAAEEARILKELAARDRRLLMTVTIPAFIGMCFCICLFLACTAKLGSYCCGLCCRKRDPNNKMV